MSDEHKQKLSTAHKGKTLSDEHKQKLSKANKGKPSSLKGTSVSKEVRQKSSATKQGVAYDDWEEFAKEQKYCPRFNETCRESCRAKHNRECFICGKPESNNITKTGKHHRLSVHHVDMDKAQGCESNWKLVPLCMSCHKSVHNEELIARLGYLIKEVN